MAVMLTCLLPIYATDNVLFREVLSVTDLASLNIERNLLNKVNNKDFLNTFSETQAIIKY